MSDVWQGPGWWLASDGKWYPADAEPGAVYDGDLPNTDAPNPTTADPSTLLPGAQAEPIADPEPVRADEVWATEPVPAAPEPVQPPTDIPAPVAEAPVVSASPEMPAPVVESAKVGGWQAIEGDEPEIPDPFANEPDPVAAAMEVAATAPVTDDGWTSAYDERQAVSEVLDQGVVAEPPAPTMDMSGIATPAVDVSPVEPTVPDVSVPDVSVPDVSIPDVAVPDMSVPDVNVPDLAAPDLSIPDVPTPDLTAPDLSIPDVPTPDLTAPDLSIPDVPTPDLTAPDLSIPDVPTPDLTAPDLSIPDVPTPDLTAPDLSIPDVPTPDLTAPGLTVPEVSIPDVQAPGISIQDPAIPDVAAPTIGVPGIDAPDLPPTATVPLENTVPLGNDVTVPRGPGAPIEREDAWRKPLAPDAAAPVAAATASVTPPGRPDVVDLAIPEEATHHHPEPQGRNWRMIGGVLVALLALVAIAWLISTLFAGNDTGTTTTDSTSSTEAPAETETTAAGDADAGTTAAAPVTEDTQAPTTEGATSVFSLRAGDCIVGDIGAGQVTKVEKVDCELEHQFEVYREALIDSSITAFDEEAISAYAEEVCRTSLAAYIPPDDERGLKFKFLQPTEDSWNQEEDPDRVITCLLFDDDAPLIGRAA